MIELNGIQLDKTSAVPLYEQLRKALLEAITSGKLLAGTKLPTEEELCAQFGISRPVARQAYNMLIEEGFVERMRGRGTFVRSPDTRGRFLNKQLSFAAEMGVLNLEHRTEVLRAEWVSYTPELFARLKLERGIAATILCVCATPTESPLFSWKTMCRNLCFPVLMPTTLPSARCTMSLKPSITRRSLNRAVC